VAKKLTKIKTLKHWRAAVAVLLVAGFCAQFVPIPYAVAPAKDRSTPYPCMDRPCGCASAEQCWKSCCCFTNQEKVVWAAKHAVQLPEYVVAAAQHETATASTQSRPACVHWVRKCDDQPDCCDDLALTELLRTAVFTRTDVEEHESVSEIAGLLLDDAAGQDDEHVVTESVSGDVDEGTQYFCGFSALKCRGEDSMWQLLSIPLPPPVDLTDLTDCGPETRLSAAAPLLSGCDRPAPDPPPRLSWFHVCA